MTATTSRQSLRRRALCVSTRPTPTRCTSSPSKPRRSSRSPTSPGSAATRPASSSATSGPRCASHIQEIVDYLNSDEVLFPNPIIMALSSQVKFQAIRGARMPGDELGITGTLEIPLPVPRPTEAGLDRRRPAACAGSVPHADAGTSPSRHRASSPTLSTCSATSSCGSTTPTAAPRPGHRTAPRGPTVRSHLGSRSAKRHRRCATCSTTTRTRRCAA